MAKQKFVTVKDLVSCINKGGDDLAHRLSEESLEMSLTELFKDPNKDDFTKEMMSEFSNKTFNLNKLIGQRVLPYMEQHGEYYFSTTYVVKPTGDSKYKHHTIHHCSGMVTYSDEHTDAVATGNPSAYHMFSILDKILKSIHMEGDALLEDLKFDYDGLFDTKTSMTALENTIGKNYPEIDYVANLDTGVNDSIQIGDIALVQDYGFGNYFQCKVMVDVKDIRKLSENKPFVKGYNTLSFFVNSLA